jgi:hypothetical protein
LTLKKLLLLTIALFGMMFIQVQAASVDTVKAAIVKHSVEMGVDPAITLSIAKTESGFRHDLRSSHGAVGVFQLMPSTARRMGLNPYSLDDNIKGGIMYYKSMYQMFGKMELAIAAYNAGPGNVKKYKAIPPFRETKRFVANIMSDYHYLKAHTDPAVAAYMKSKKSTVASASAKNSTELPKKVTDSKIVANANSQKAPIPVTRIEQSTANKATIKGSPFEVELKMNSVQM